MLRLGQARSKPPAPGSEKITLAREVQQYTPGICQMASPIGSWICQVLPAPPVVFTPGAAISPIFSNLRIWPISPFSHFSRIFRISPDSPRFLRFLNIASRIVLFRPSHTIPYYSASRCTIPLLPGQVQLGNTTDGRRFQDLPARFQK